MVICLRKMVIHFIELLICLNELVISLKKLVVNLNKLLIRLNKIGIKSACLFPVTIERCILFTTNSVHIVVVAETEFIVKYSPIYFLKFGVSWDKLPCQTSKRNKLNNRCFLQGSLLEDEALGACSIALHGQSSIENR